MKTSQNRRVLRLVAASLAAALAAAPLAASGPNLLANPGFASSFAGWENSQGHASWVTADAHGDPHSGALREINSVPESVEYQTQCVPAAPGPYVGRVSAWVEGPTGTNAVLNLQFLSSTCAGNTPLQSFDSDHTFTSGWNELDVAAIAPAGTVAVRVLLLLNSSQTAGTATVYWDDAYLGTGTCAPTATSLCLNHGRFRVTARFKDGNGQADARAVPFADESGSFWFFGPDNIELDVKVIDGCALSNSYWIFAAGQTNVGVTLTVTDTLHPTAYNRTYTNPDNHTFQTITDTVGIATCS